MKRFWTRVILAGVCGMPAFASAEDWSHTCGDPHLPEGVESSPVNIIFEYPEGSGRTNATAVAFIHRGWTAKQKRDEIVKVIKGIEPNTIAVKNSAELIVRGLPSGTTVTFDEGETAETDNSGSSETMFARTTFSGSFNPFDASGQPAVFTAGIITDIGTLSATVSAQELGFQTVGPIICQALFQRLAPHVTDYGAQIQPAGEHLDFHFDPAGTSQRGGIVFGTTSPTAGCLGTTRVAGPLLSDGDMNCDGSLNGFDIAGFVLALNDPDEFDAQHPNCNSQQADMNGDGSINGFDIQIFTELLNDP